jgi:hypothetical protein
MNITIVTTEKIKKKIPVLEDDGKTQKKIKGVHQFEEREETEFTEHLFETHEHELVSSAVKRAIKELRLPAPPPDKEVTLREHQSGGSLLMPGHTLGKGNKDKKFKLTTW